MSRFVPSDIRPTVVANADILYNCVMVDGPVLRVMMDGLGLDYPVVLVGGSFLCGGVSRLWFAGALSILA